MPHMNEIRKHMPPETVTAATYKHIFDPLIEEAQSVALGIFSFDAVALWTNNALQHFLTTAHNQQETTCIFVNPELQALAAATETGCVFEGIITIGDRRSTSYNFNGKVFKTTDHLLVFAEVDVPALFHENSKMSQLNQEINNLQRQLIKEKKALQQTLAELKETQMMLVQAEKMNSLGKMVAGVAHEINNPVAFIYSNTYSLEKAAGSFMSAYQQLEELLQQSGNQAQINQLRQIRQTNDLDYLMEDIPEMFKESKSGLERVKKIVEDLRKFSRLDESAIKHIDLIGNITSTLSIARAAMDQKEIDFTLDAPAVLFMDCYPGQLNQALLNILINATQAVAQKGKVTLQVKEMQDHVLVSISDDGCGIPKDIQSKIFDPFFTTKPVGSGTGLGLSITYKIIHDLHKGTIEVISEPQQGSTFQLKLNKTR